MIRVRSHPVLPGQHCARGAVGLDSWGWQRSRLFPGGSGGVRPSLVLGPAATRDGGSPFSCSPALTCRNQGEPPTKSQRQTPPTTCLHTRNAFLVPDSSRSKRSRWLYQCGASSEHGAHQRAQEKTANPPCTFGMEFYAQETSTTPSSPLAASG